MTLKPCPFCGAKVGDYDDPAMIDHKKRCWLGNCTCIYSWDKAAIAAWNRRTPDWEQRYGELVETVSARTDQAKGKK